MVDLEAVALVAVVVVVVIGREVHMELEAVLMEDMVEVNLVDMEDMVEVWGLIGESPPSDTQVVMQAGLTEVTI